MADQNVHEDIGASDNTGTCTLITAMAWAIGEAPPKPAANSKIQRLRPLAPPGHWTVVCSSQGSSIGHLGREGWAVACATVKQPTVPPISGPKFFSPGLVDTSDSAGGSEDHFANATPNGNLTATSPYTGVLYTRPPRDRAFPCGVRPTTYIMLTMTHLRP